MILLPHISTLLFYIANQDTYFPDNAPPSLNKLWRLKEQDTAQGFYELGARIRAPGKCASFAEQAMAAARARYSSKFATG